MSHIVGGDRAVAASELSCEVIELHEAKLVVVMELLEVVLCAAHHALNKRHIVEVMLHHRMGVTQDAAGLLPEALMHLQDGKRVVVTNLGAKHEVAAILQEQIDHFYRRMSSCEKTKVHSEDRRLLCVI